MGRAVDSRPPMVTTADATRRNSGRSQRSRERRRDCRSLAVSIASAARRSCPTRLSNRLADCHAAWERGARVGAVARRRRNTSKSDRFPFLSTASLAATRRITLGTQGRVPRHSRTPSTVFPSRLTQGVVERRRASPPRDGPGCPLDCENSNRRLRRRAGWFRARMWPRPAVQRVETACDAQGSRRRRRGWWYLPVSDPSAACRSRPTHFVCAHAGCQRHRMTCAHDRTAV